MAASRNSTSMSATMTSISPLSVPEHLFHCKQGIATPDRKKLGYLGVKGHRCVAFRSEGAFGGSWVSHGSIEPP